MAAILLAAILAFALSQLGLHRVGHALASAAPGWVLLALALMSLSLLLRAISWHEVCAPRCRTSRSPGRRSYAPR